MRAYSIRYTIVAAATLAFLAGCGGSSRLAPFVSGNSPQSSLRQSGATSPLMLPPKTTPIVFAADQGGFQKPSGICAYANTGTNQSPAWCQSGSPLKYPSGLWVDKTGNLYVDDFSGSVFEYNTPTLASAPGNPSFTYSDALAGQDAYEPVDATVCGSYLYAANLINLSGSNLSFGFTVWKIGTAKPLEIVHSQYDAIAGNGGNGYGIGCDSNNNLLFAYTDSYLGAGSIDEWTEQNGSTAPTFVKTIPPACTYLQGLAIGANNLLASGDPFYAKNCNSANPESPAVLEFNEAKSAPTHVCTTKIAPALADPYSVAWELSDKHLWVADLGNNTLYRVSMGTCLTAGTITKGLNGNPFSALDGVAVFPPEIP